jgi:putative two-component system hydrogenase maturation factor HypX/HoxX
MLGLGADIVAAREGIVLNPYYDIGLYGSELHTFTLPRRVGPGQAQQLVDDKLPLSCSGARAIGLVDEVGPRQLDAYGEWLQALAERESEGHTARHRRQQKARRLAAERVPLEVYADRSGFAAARHAFVRKVKPAETPSRLLMTGRVAAAPRRRPAKIRPAVPVSA